MRKREQERILYDYKNKVKNFNTKIDYMLARTNKMFEYTGLPETINARQMEKLVQCSGYGIILPIEESDIIQDERNVKHIEPGVYVLYGSAGGVLDFNYDFTKAVVAHPLLKKSKELKIGEECVLLRNDSFMSGLLPMFEMYATSLVENEITMNLADIQSRIVSILTAGDADTIKSAELFIQSIKDGNMTVINDPAFTEALKLATLPYADGANNTITNLIELQQYLKASWYNEIGLSANYNMKREAINSSEAQMGQDSLRPLVDDMLHERQEAWDLANKLFGTDVHVDFHETWKHSLVGEDTNLEEVSEDGETIETVEDIQSTEEIEETKETEETKEEVKEDKEDA